MRAARVITLAVTLSAAGLGCLRMPAGSRPQASLDPVAVAVDARPVPLNPADLSQTAVGAFVYAGGLELTARDSDRLHGLSDVEVVGDRLIAVSDFGDLLEARLVFGAGSRLTGLADVRLTPLVGEDGFPLPGKSEGDAEGLAILPNGDRLVSFERHHRILLYPAAGGAPRAVPSPDVHLEDNHGLEALAADPDSAPDAYVAGAEGTGATWHCRVSAPCVPGPVVEKPEEFGLVALRRLPGGRTAYLLRAYDPERGNRVALQIFQNGTLVDRMDMARPMTIDNFEGVAGEPQGDGTVRFYLLSDDNENDTQRTLLLAFDWRP